ncbi:MAG: DNA topoisomerase VI subunit B [Deltaproteobacteria bacterium]|nr:DNA topoisomerase VI subunit B [Deltaproteobacteria bacterium]
MAKNQKEISISEFFTKNRHLLGFDNPKKALLTAVREGVDNSLDACEEAGILPEIVVEIHPTEKEDRFRVVMEDNGPGIVEQQIPNIFARLLYGSKFHRLRMSRGQQGIGISAAGLYGTLTTGKPLKVISRTGPRKHAVRMDLKIDSRKNTPEILFKEACDWHRGHGTRVEIELEARYQKGRQSVDDYLRQTAIANPHVALTYRTPEGETIEFQRATKELPPPPRELKPHPHGIELGALIDMLKITKARSVKSFLVEDFSRVSAGVAEEILKTAKLSLSIKPGSTSREQADALFHAIGATKIRIPPTDCVVPIGEELLKAGLLKELEKGAETDIFCEATSRKPTVYRGNPFVVEVALAYGGGMPADETVRLLRFANRVPLLYQQSACAVTKSVINTDWRNYGLQQPKGALPIGPLVVMVHIASVWVPYTSESKEAIAHYPEIIKEFRLALQETGRKLGAHIKRRRREADAAKKFAYIEKYIPHIGIALQEILGLTDEDRKKTVDVLSDTLARSRQL